MTYSRRPYGRNYANSSRPSYNRADATVDFSTVKPAPTVKYNLSSYQQAILDWVTTSSGNLTVKATAGSGKTFILARVSELLANTNAVYLVFGRANADEAKGKFSIPASTFHSLCYRAIGSYLFGRCRKKIQTNGSNVHTIIDGLYQRNLDEIRSALASIVGKVKAENLPVDPSDNDLQFIVDQYGIDWESDQYTEREIFVYVREILKETVNVNGIAQRGAIDFDDQLWLVERFNLKLDTFDWVLVDECQDTSQIRRAIIRRVMHATSRLIAVGDDDQAIYAFAGATNDALALITEEFSCTVLPLSISYRCSAAVVALAAQYGTIEASPTAIDGAILRPEKTTFADVAKQQLVLCRTTAPLITLAYKMIARRLPVMMRGRDIGQGLKSLIVKLAGKRGTLESLPEKIEAYRTRECARAAEKREDNKVMSINDKCDSLIALLDSMTQDECEQGIAGALASIDTLFGLNTPGYADAGLAPNRPCLSTIHKAKGLEADNVAILDWHLVPHKMAKRDDQKLQERHLQFVAVTRSKDTLTFFESETLGQE